MADRENSREAVMFGLRVRNEWSSATECARLGPRSVLRQAFAKLRRAPGSCHDADQLGPDTNGTSCLAGSHRRSASSCPTAQAARPPAGPSRFACPTDRHCRSEGDRGSLSFPLSITGTITRYHRASTPVKMERGRIARQHGRRPDRRTWGGITGGGPERRRPSMTGLPTGCRSRASTRRATCDLGEEPSPTPADRMRSCFASTAVGLCGSDRHWYEDGSIGGTSIDARARPGPRVRRRRRRWGPGRRAGRRRSGGAVRDLPDLHERPRRAVPDGRVRRVSRDRRGVASRSRPGRRAGCCTLPDGIGDDEATLLEPLGIALHAVHLAEVTADVDGRRRRPRTDRPADRACPASRGRGATSRSRSRCRTDSTWRWPPGRGRSARTTRSTWRSRWRARTRPWTSRSTGSGRAAGWSSSASPATTGPRSRHRWHDERG